MDKPDTQTTKAKPDAKSAVLGLSMAGVGLLTLIPAVIGLIIVGGVTWYGGKFLIGLVRIFAS